MCFLFGDLIKCSRKRLERLSFRFIGFDISQKHNNNNNNKNIHPHDSDVFLLKKK